MVNYDLFSKHYDAVMGVPKSSVIFIKKQIKQYKPDAKKILEIACGTGSVLKLLEKNYSVYGLDFSKGMLSIAKKKVTSGKFFHQDMTKFRINEKFDIILCVFDSINHLLKFNQWQQVFSKVNSHLNDGGIFIFDINMQNKLDRLISDKPWNHWFGKNLLIIDITEIRNKISNWNTKVFQYKNNNIYEMYEENIKEKAFPLVQIKKSLQKYFSVKVIDPERKRPSRLSERLYLICKK
jgi:SAM-dependent methyltransferase